MKTRSDLEDTAPRRGRSPTSASSAVSGFRILLLTPYTGGNLGDGAIQDAVVHNFRKRLSDPMIRMVTLSPRVTSELHGLPSFPIASPVNDGELPPPESSTLAPPDRRNASANFKQSFKQSLRRVPWFFQGLKTGKRIIQKFMSTGQGAQREVRHLLQAHRLLKETDLLLVSGGGQIDDYWGGAFGHPYALVKWASLARVSKIPVVFLSVGVCSLGSSWSRRFALRALRLAAYRSYRDRGSKELLREASFTHSDPVYPDLAFSHPCTRQPPFIPVDPTREKSVIGISPIAYLSPHGWPERDQGFYARYLRVLCELTGKILEAGHTVVLFTSALMDQHAVNDLHAKLQQSPGSESWGGRLRQVEQTCLEKQLEEIRKMDMVLASRLHGVILSHLLGKPALAISYDRKVRAHMESMGQQRFCFNHRDCSLSQLWDGFEKLGLESNAIAADIRFKVKESGQKLDQQYDLVVQLVGQIRQNAGNVR